MIEALDYLLEQDTAAVRACPMITSKECLLNERLFEGLLFGVKDMFHFVLELRDPRAIPVLLKTHAGGFRGTILNFGPLAELPHTLACVFNREALEESIMTCLNILSVLVAF